MSSYVGTKVRVIGEFKDFDLKPADPDVVVVIVEGAAQTPVRDGVGVYHYDYVPATPGRKVLQIVGTGAVQAASEIAIEIYDHLI